jgi:hypothetical protein
MPATTTVDRFKRDFIIRILGVVVDEGKRRESVNQIVELISRHAFSKVIERYFARQEKR